MLGRIFPKQFDNAYRGHWLAIWLLALVVLAKSIMCYQSLFNTGFAIQTADSIALDTFGAAGARAFVSIFRLLGLDNLLLNLLGVGVLIRYRAMIPFMYLLLTVEQVSRKLLLLTNPIVRTGAPPVLPFNINLVLLTMLLIGLILSLQGKGYHPRQEVESIRT